MNTIKTFTLRAIYDRSFWIYTLLWAATCMILIGLVDRFTNGMQDGQYRQLFEIFQGLQYWAQICTMVRMANFLLLMMLIMFVTQDITRKTVRIFLTNGLSRTQVLGGYLFYAVAFALLSLLLIIVASALMGSNRLLFNDWKQVGMLWGGFLVQNLVYFTFAILIATFARKTSHALALLFVWSALVEPLVGFVAKYKFEWVISDYLPFRAAGYLLPDSFQLMGPENWVGVPLNFLAISLGYVALFVVGAWWRVKVTDF